jgi:hypothetical protein
MLGLVTSIRPAKRSGKTQIGSKLSNSGDTLTLLVPSYIRKSISGWNNYPGMVIIPKIDENKMGNRGSKSVLNSKTNTVKEQRVDGSWCINSKLEDLHLRCTLMGFERNYRIKYPSKQLIKNFSNLHNSSNILNPWFISGFTDAEGTFTVMIDRNIKRTYHQRCGLACSS